MSFKFHHVADWVDFLRRTQYKRPLPFVAFPAIQLLYIDMEELVNDSTQQAVGIKLISDKYKLPVALGYMDLSVEAEAFGSETIYSPTEVPTISGSIVSTEEEADALQIPEVGAGRTGVNIEGIRKTLKLVKDKPVFAQCIGPFSLAGRLLDVNDAMVYCYEEPDMVHTVLEKATQFIIDYIKAYKEVGAHGIVIAEPLAGILSPNLAAEFSATYCKRIVEEVQDDDFIVFYHNCGKEVLHQAESIFSIGAKAYHFGDASPMLDIIKVAPEDVLIMGNISPTTEFRYGTVASIRKATTMLLDACTEYENFWLSSGCDIPPMTPLENITAFFDAAYEFRTRQNLFDALKDE